MALTLAALFLAISTIVSASPVALRATHENHLLISRDNNTSLLPYSLPNDDSNLLRAADILTKQATFTYGPAIGAGPASPAGVLGETYFTIDTAIVHSELTAQVAISTNDSVVAHLKTVSLSRLAYIYRAKISLVWRPQDA